MFALRPAPDDVVWRSVRNDRAFRARPTGWGRRKRDDEQKRELHRPRGLSRQKKKKTKRRKKTPPMQSDT